MFIEKPFISEVIHVKCLTFAKEYVNQLFSFWHIVIFSNKSKYNLFRSDGCGYVWRKKNCELKTKNLLPTVKFWIGKVLVWGCMAASGVGNLVFIDGHMTAMMYVDILHANLKTSARKLDLEDCIHFQQDDNPKHASLCARKCLLYNAPCRLLTSLLSPIMNVIENLWNLLELEVCKKKILNREDLKKAPHAAWSEICLRVTANLVDSMPHHLPAVINANCMHTKY